MKNNVLDQTLDLNGAELHRVSSLYPLPAFVKNASQEEVCGNQNTPSHLFGDMVRRLYPVHTPAATAVSTIFFQEKQASLSKHQQTLVGERLAQAARYFKIEPQIKMLKEAAAKAGAEASLHDDDFAVVFGQGQDKERHYPLRNPGEVKAAAAWLVKERYKLAFADRNAIADRILEKAAAFGVGLPEQRYELEKMAGLGACSGKDAAALVRARALMLGHINKPNAIQSELLKLAGLCERTPERIQHHEVLLKIAQVLDEFDRANGLTAAYDDRLESPEDVLFAVTKEAVAKVSQDVIGSSLTGNYYSGEDLKAVPIHDLSDVLGQEFVDATTTAGAWLDLEKLAAVVSSLPKGDAEDFDMAVMHAGVRPVITKAASLGKAISPEEQAELAKRQQTRPGSLWDRI